MSDDTITIVLIVLGWVVFSAIWHWFRSRFLLEQWAKANGFVLVKMSMSWFKLNPFLSSKRQEVYRITVRNHNGRERSGWVKCGGFWLGFLVNKVEVDLD